MKSGDVLSGKYQLEQEIGKGAMGAVWAAYDLTMNRRVALKAILPQAREQLTNDLRHRLLREARACGKLKHRHIVQIFDVGETPEGEPFIILELLHGQTLADRLKEKRRIEPAMAAHIAAEVASGLAVAHAAHVIHRDLKPANIFLHREEGMPEEMFVTKILDFGVCKNLDSVDSVATQTGTAVGSPAYMSPEQVGMRKDIDHRTDLWSLGIVLFEMLTGARPFSGSVQDVIRNILLVPVPPPSSRVRDVPPELDAIVARCTAGKREGRYGRADELANDLFALARSVRPITRKATFTGVGPTPSLSQSSIQDRPSGSPLTNAPAPSPIAPPGVTATSISQGIDQSDLEATLPMQGRMLIELRLSAPQPAQRSSAPQPAQRSSAPTGTEILPGNETLASPAPAWNKIEMQMALAAHRRTHSSSADISAPEHGAEADTLMVSDSQVQLMPSAPDPVGTTSSAGALSQRTTGHPVPSAPLVPMDPVSTTGKHKQAKKVVLAVVGTGIAAAVAVFVLIAVSVTKFAEADGQAGAYEAKPLGSQAVVTPAVPEPSAPQATPPPPAAADAPAPVVAPPASALAPATPTAIAKDSSPPAPAPTAPQTKPVSQPPPKLTSPSLTPNPFTQKAPPPATAPAPAPCRWEGSGLTRKCVKIGR